MKRILFVAICLILAGCASDPVHTNYRGKDAGFLVFSAGSIDGPEAVMFFYRKVGQASGYRNFGGDGGIYYNPGSILGDKPDYTGRETGEVKVVRLEPGKYEVYSWKAVEGASVVEMHYSPHKDFALPFTINPGEATYIGNFAYVSLDAKSHKPIGFPLYVVSNKHERDLEIARKKEPKLPQAVTIQVIDVSKLGAPSLIAKEPQ